MSEKNFRAVFEIETNIFDMGEIIFNWTKYEKNYNF